MLQAAGPAAADPVVRRGRVARRLGDGRMEVVIGDARRWAVAATDEAITAGDEVYVVALEGAAGALVVLGRAGG